MSSGTSPDILSRWQHIDVIDAAQVVDARLQLHHALQVIVSAPISFLTPRADDSHTNLEWLPSLEALGTNWLDGAMRVRFALRPAQLTLLAVDESGVTSEYALEGRTVRDAVGWLRESLARVGYDGAALTTDKHYEIPTHLVADGRPFSSDALESCVELASSYANTHALTTYVAATRGGSPPRCWPHHFDLATLITLPQLAGRGTRTVGVGLSPGDDLYPEPYFYVGPYPPPNPERLKPLCSLGTWHTTGWVGGVLRLSEIAQFGEARRQAEAVHAFADAAIEASIEALA